MSDNDAKSANAATTDGFADKGSAFRRAQDSSGASHSQSTKAVLSDIVRRRDAALRRLADR